MIILGALLSRSGSSGTRAGGLALGFGRFGSLERVFLSVRSSGGCGAVIRRARSGEDPTHTQNWNGGLTGLSLGVCVWVWVGSHTNWTGVVWCACQIYDDAKVRHPHTYVPLYLTIFAFGSDHFRSLYSAFGQVGQVGGIRIERSTRFWRVLGRIGAEQ